MQEVSLYLGYVEDLGFYSTRSQFDQGTKAKVLQKGRNFCNVKIFIIFANSYIYGAWFWSKTAR